MPRIEDYHHYGDKCLDRWCADCKIWGERNTRAANREYVKAGKPPTTRLLPTKPPPTKPPSKKQKVRFHVLFADRLFSLSQTFLSSIYLYTCINLALHLYMYFRRNRWIARTTAAMRSLLRHSRRNWPLYHSHPPLSLPSPTRASQRRPSPGVPPPTLKILLVASVHIVGKYKL